MPGPLEGYRIIDLTAIAAGPFATMMLADQGADVIKVEPPGIGDMMRLLGTSRGGLSVLRANCNRSKRSIGRDLRDERGRGGQHVRVSMLDAAIAFMWPDCGANEAVLEQDVNVQPLLSATYRVSETSDGYFVAAGISDAPVHGMFRALGWPELASDPQVVASDTFFESQHPKLGRMREPQPPIRFEGTPAAVQRPAPALGEHTEEVVGELGLDAGAIAALRSDGVVC